MQTVVVRGSGDVGSAVAHLLFQCDYRVLIHDVVAPTHTRRGMAFTDAIFDGVAELSAVLGKRATTVEAVPHMLECHRAVPLSVCAFDDVTSAVSADVIIDARMRKRSRPEVQKGLAALTVGLGPNFEAGVTTDIVVETAWGDRLGAVITVGESMPLSGEPQPIAGVTRDRYVYAPIAGMFSTVLQVGASVEARQPVGKIGDTIISAPMRGRLRGLTHNGVSVAVGTKIVEIDPRGDSAQVRGLGERPRVIADGVLNAMKSWHG